MKKIYFMFATMIVALFMTSCSLATVDGGEEGVFIKKPLFFGVRKNFKK